MWTNWSITITMSRLLRRPAHSHTQPTSPVMGRPRQFVPAEALRDALNVFWEKGYQASSPDDLTAAMHLSRSSFYACFTLRKAGLPVAALQTILSQARLLLADTTSSV